LTGDVLLATNSDRNYCRCEFTMLARVILGRQCVFEMNPGFGLCNCRFIIS